jgi:HSP20 family protein
MLMRTDPFRELDRFAQSMFGAASQPQIMHMDAYQRGDEFVVHFDLPGVAPESIDLNVERNVLTVRAERGAPEKDVDLVVSERPTGTFTRQLFLGETLDADRIDARYEAGVLTLVIPVAEQAKPRKIEISGGTDRKVINA